MSLPSLERFNDLIEDFKLKTIEDTDFINEIEYGEDKKIQLLIVMDNVFGLADQPNNAFANFLTVTRKFADNCIYIFHLFYRKKKSGKK